MVLTLFIRKQFCFGSPDFADNLTAAFSSLSARSARGCIKVKCPEHCNLSVLTLIQRAGRVCSPDPARSLPLFFPTDESRRFLPESFAVFRVRKIHSRGNPAEQRQHKNTRQQKTSANFSPAAVVALQRDHGIACNAQFHDLHRFAVPECLCVTAAYAETDRLLPRIASKSEGSSALSGNSTISTALFSDSRIRNMLPSSVGGCISRILHNVGEFLRLSLRRCPEFIAAPIRAIRKYSAASAVNTTPHTKKRTLLFCCIFFSFPAVRHKKPHTFARFTPTFLSFSVRRAYRSRGSGGLLPPCNRTLRRRRGKRRCVRARAGRGFR